MCTIPPPPPPPLTPAPMEPSKLAKVNELIFSDDLCQWASDSPEMRESCLKNNICLYEPPDMFYYKQFDSILQEGPTCGLVALSMLLRGRVCAKDIFDIAKIKGYTNNGEMFSCKNMVELAKETLGLADLLDVDVSLCSGTLYTNELVKKLLGGAVLLVPYDADFNHTPCLKKGHKAHWALVCGVIITKTNESSYIDDPSNIYLLCRHGKSKYVSSWKLKDLYESNKNLLEFAPRREDDGWIYILPEGGIAGQNGLKDQYLLFEGL